MKVFVKYNLDAIGKNTFSGWWLVVSGWWLVVGG
jgi:hypothetical protein